MTDMKYRIVECTQVNRPNYARYEVEVFKSFWYWPFKKEWQPAISWDDCGYDVPWFSSYKEAEDYIKKVTIPIQRKVVYEDKDID